MLAQARIHETIREHLDKKPFAKVVAIDEPDVLTYRWINMLEVIVL